MGTPRFLFLARPHRELALGPYRKYPNTMAYKLHTCQVTDVSACPPVAGFYQEAPLISRNRPRYTRSCVPGFALSLFNTAITQRQTLTEPLWMPSDTSAVAAYAHDHALHNTANLVPWKSETHPFTRREHNIIAHVALPEPCSWLTTVEQGSHLGGSELERGRQLHTPQIDQNAF